MEDALAAELRVLGIGGIRIVPGGVSFAGSLADAYRVCLWARTAERVLLELARFPALGREQIYNGVRTVDWTDHLTPRTSIACQAIGITPTLRNSHYTALVVKDAVVDALRERFGERPMVNVRRPDVRLQLLLRAGWAVLSLDLSGDALHRRGYRTPGRQVQAPLKETLAAGMLTIAGWPQMAATACFVDPLCGSGTLPLEAALMAADVAPGLLRQEWGFLRWRGHDDAAWRRVVDEATERRAAGTTALAARARDLGLPPILGFDKDPRAIALARSAILRAGLSGMVAFNVHDMNDLQNPFTTTGAATTPVAGGLVAANPPYGARLHGPDIDGVYEALGETLRRAFPGWRAAVLLADEGRAAQLGAAGVRAAAQLRNGPIPCTLLRFEVGTEGPAAGDPPVGTEVVRQRSFPEPHEATVVEPGSAADLPADAPVEMPAEEAATEDPETPLGEPIEPPLPAPAEDERPAPNRVEDDRPTPFEMPADGLRTPWAEQNGPPDHSATRAQPADGGAEAAAPAPVMTAPEPAEVAPALLAPSAETTAAAATAAIVPTPGAFADAAEQFADRLRRNLRVLGRPLRRRGVDCYRVYDADLPDFNLAVDLYAGWAHVQEYQAPAAIDPAKAAARLQAALAALPAALSIDPERVVLKTRRRQRGADQYERLAAAGDLIEVHEGAATYLVNLTDHIDTGLFLHQRLLRELVSTVAASRSFLNLFGYTGTATVAAALGGALDSVTVDLSVSYLDWARRNFVRNGLDLALHRTEHADCLRWLREAAATSQRFDLILLGPPTFSNSTSMGPVTLDIQRDHVDLIRDAARLLTRNGVLLFVCGAHRFDLDVQGLREYAPQDLSKRTLPPDFSRRAAGHHVWRLSASARNKGAGGAPLPRERSAVPPGTARRGTDTASRNAPPTADVSDESPQQASGRHAGTRGKLPAVPESGERPRGRSADQRPATRPSRERPSGSPAEQRPAGRRADERPKGRPSGERPRGGSSEERPAGRPAGERQWRPKSGRRHLRPPWLNELPPGTGAWTEAERPARPSKPPGGGHPKRSSAGPEAERPARAGKGPAAERPARTGGPSGSKRPGPGAGSKSARPPRPGKWQPKDARTGAGSKDERPSRPDKGPRTDRAPRPDGPSKGKGARPGAGPKGGKPPSPGGTRRKDERPPRPGAGPKGGKPSRPGGPGKPARPGGKRPGAGPRGGKPSRPGGPGKPARPGGSG